MFVEEENKNWKHDYICAMLIVFFNIGIIITCRVLLDKENEFDEPIITGDLRYKLEFFLLYFSVSFCFACCCCFCCLGKCFGWIANILCCCNWSMSDALTKSLQRPASEALRQQHEVIDAARENRRASLMPGGSSGKPPRRPSSIAIPTTAQIRHYSNFGFNEEQIV